MGWWITSSPAKEEASPPEELARSSPWASLDVSIRRSRMLGMALRNTDGKRPIGRLRCQHSKVRAAALAYFSYQWLEVRTCGFGAQLGEKRCLCKMIMDSSALNALKLTIINATSIIRYSCILSLKIMKNQPRNLPHQGLPSPRSFSQELSGPWRLKPPRSGKSRQPGISCQKAWPQRIVEH